MKCDGRITVTVSDDQQADNLMQLFLTEDFEFANGRSAYHVDKNGHSIDFIVKATDSTALRTALNAITKVLTVYEKMDLH
ncbi:MAG: KEOPS complex subunit Pcc1 [Nanoarchaeota archaeon]